MRKHLDIFWKLVDEILNAILYLLVGLEVLTLAMSGKHVWLLLNT